MRLFLQGQRVLVRPQVAIVAVGRVDLLVGRSLIVECDSQAHHSDYRVDRRRDLAARELGYQVLRLSFDQVMFSWAETRRSIMAIVRSRQHLRPPVPLR